MIMIFSSSLSEDANVRIFRYPNFCFPNLSFPQWSVVLKIVRSSNWNTEKRSLQVTPYIREEDLGQPKL